MKYRVASWLQPLIDWFWSNKANILAEEDFVFDHPNYAGMPADIWQQLEPHVVDTLQECITELLRSSRTRTSFAKQVVNSLGNGLVVIV